MTYHKCGSIYVTNNSDVRIGSASGGVANFNTSLALPLANLKAYFNATQASGTPTPATPLPISGWNAITLDVNGNTEAINLGGTYYGGHFTQDKAGHRQLVVTWASIDLGTLTWYKATSGGITRFTGYPPTPNKLVKPKTATDSERQSLKCSIYSVSNTLSGSWGVTLSSNYSCVLSYAQGTDYIAIKNDDYTSEADFKTAMSGVIMFYKLQEQYYTVIDLPDGYPINALIGTNNIFADSGNCEVEFKKLAND